MYLDELRLWLSSLAIWSLSEQVMKKIRVTIIEKKVYSMIEDEIYVFTTNFVENFFVEHCHDERKLWLTSDSIWRSDRWSWEDIWFQIEINSFFDWEKYIINVVLNE